MTPTPTTHALATAREDLAGDAALRAGAARAAAERCTGEDRDYLVARAEWFERTADRLRDAQRGERG